MSLTTAFPFHAYVGDLKTRKVMEHKSGVSLSLLSSEDMARIACVEVRTRCGQEEPLAPWLPVRRQGESYATFYDTRMGNFDVRAFPSQACTTCASTLTGKFGNERCTGHFGYLRMPRRYPNDPYRAQEHLFVINPHLAEETEQLLQAKCFFCHRFRVPELDVERYLQALRLLDAGLVGEALHLLDVVANARGQEIRQRRRREVNEEVISDVATLREHVEKILAAKGVPVTAAAQRKRGAKKGERPGEVNEEDEDDDEEEEGGAARETAPRQTDTSVLDIRNQICKQAIRDFREFINVCSHCHAISPRITTRHGHLFFFFNKKNADFNVAQGCLTQAQLRAWEENNRRHNRSHTYFLTTLVRQHIKELCQKEGRALGAIFPGMGQATLSFAFLDTLPSHLLYKVFFLDKLLVPPLPLRLSSGVQVGESGNLVPDEQTRALSDVLGFVEQIEAYFTLQQRAEADEVQGFALTTAQEVAHELNLRNLQAKVNEIYEGILDSFAKKEGLFRMHMMGKRVNQACRSVISPDYCVEPNEVLLPRVFARSLTYPEQVSTYAPARLLLLRRCVMNGPQIYPGATHLELRFASGEVRFIDLNVPEHTRRQHAMKYFAMAQTATLIVHRHILDHDRLVFNRQPTLHKPSMMGYRAKVLSGLKTLRFHYVNGKSYNADFDGDEMNVHVPQSLEARAELECLMDANLNYLVPTSGKPIRGLIQDHIVAGVLLTLRDKLLDHDSFVQLVYAGLAPYMRLQSQFAAFAGGLGKMGRPSLTELVPVPAVLKPRARWTGKQLISVLVHFVTRAAQSSSTCGGAAVNEGVSLRGISLIQPAVYTTTDAKTGRTVIRGREEVMEDSWVQFLGSELITGVLCKNQLGPSNMCLAHVVHEIYGPHVVGELFGALGRILTLSLQREGFSMGMDDMYLVQEERRAALLRELDVAPLALPEDEAEVMPVLMQRATALQREFVPGRMLRPFPQNQLLMMTMSGAKGSNTNTIQMSLGLGQQLFDGRRVQRMNSGKTMPAFFAHERRARSFGYAMGRFASGIRPAEYTIHAMAGRDGLIDTAVKTSRSGHLQRCLIKGLESLVVHWDHSVRDANGSVIQFLYGGDGLDPMRASTLTAWEMAKDNVVDLGRRFKVDIMGSAAPPPPTATTGNNNTTTSNEEMSGNAPGARKRGRHDEDDAASAAREVLEQTRVDADAHDHPIPAHLQRQLEQYLECKASFPLFRKVGQVARWNRQGTTLDKLREKRRENVTFYAELLADVTARRRMRAFCDAGEPVGLLAAQAAGEPSTQMTLNTFHSAGSTVTHVTEGIPRLRELLIHGSVQKAAVVVPVKGAKERDEAALQRIVQAGVAVRLADCLAVPGKSYHYELLRGPHGMTLTVALLFSKVVLRAKAEAMCMSHGEHLHSFRVALKACARQIVSILRGRTRDKAGANGGSGAGGGENGQGNEAAVGEAAAMDEDEDETAGAAVSGGLLRRPVSDPAELRRRGKAGPALRRRRDDNDDDEDEDGDEDDDKSNYGEENDEDGDEEMSGDEVSGEEADNATSTQMSTPAIRPRDLGRRRARLKRSVAASSSAAEHDDDEGDDEDDEGSDKNNNHNEEEEEEEDRARRGNTKQRKGRASHGQGISAAEEEGQAGGHYTTRSSNINSNSTAESYDDFDVIRAVYGGKRFLVTIRPVTAATAAASIAAVDGTAHMPDDLFVVELTIEVNQNVVAVIPDVVDRVLGQLTLPSWLPQFTSVSFTRSSEDHSSGQLVFQGPSATVRNVTALISLFTVGCRAIQLRQAHSTDIADMCLALGVESGYRALYDELDKLFRRYAVDCHHLTLIADAATHRGVWENFNFTGVIAHSASPLFQMTFASSKRFLHTALTRGVDDKLSSISAAIMVGERPKVGTACVKLSQDTSLLHDIVERNLGSARE